MSQWAAYGIIEYLMCYSSESYDLQGKISITLEASK